MINDHFLRAEKSLNNTFAVRSLQIQNHFQTLVFIQNHLKQDTRRQLQFWQVTDKKSRKKGSKFLEIRSDQKIPTDLHTYQPSYLPTYLPPTLLPTNLPPSENILEEQSSKETCDLRDTNQYLTIEDLNS